MIKEEESGRERGESGESIRQQREGDREREWVRKGR